MKIITLKVEIEVEDDYFLDDEKWLLEDAVNGAYEYSATKIN